MNATKILWVQVLVVCAAVLGFVWGATEWTAWRLAFQPQLGEPWFTLFGWPVYQPPAFFWWRFAYVAYAHDIFVTGGFIAGAGGVASFTVAVALSVWRAREVKRVTTFMARHAGPRRARSARRGSLIPTAFCSAAAEAPIFAMTARSMCCASRRPVPARASDWSCRRCSPGLARRSSTTSRARTGG